MRVWMGMRRGAALAALLLLGHAAAAEESAVPVVAEEAPAADDNAAEAARAAFEKGVAEYREHTNTDDWRARVGIDRRLLRAAGTLDPAWLKERLRASNNDLAVATAVAVCLGQGSVDDPKELVADLWAELLVSRYERVRYRAAESITQRVQDGTLPPDIRERLIGSLKVAGVLEQHQLNSDSMQYALKLLAE